MISIHGTPVNAKYESQVYSRQSETIPVRPVHQTSDRNPMKSKPSYEPIKRQLVDILA